MQRVVGDQLGNLLVLAGNLGGLTRVRVKRGRGHLCREFVEAALKQGDVGKDVHAGEKRAGDLRIARAAGCGLCGGQGSARQVA